MGYGKLTATSYSVYNTSMGRSYDTTTNKASYRSIDQEFTSRNLPEELDPKKFKFRECVNNEEHPNTVPVILALDVTGSMGDGCKEVAESLGSIILNLYENIPDIEFCVMGIGDLAYDRGPIQMSQFESDVRIAEALDKLWMEHGGGGNSYESYTAAWYMGLKRTKLDCYDKQHRKGIIITMGDEPLNPYLPYIQLNSAVKSTEQADIETKDLYDLASEKFDIFHIGVDDKSTSFSYYKPRIEKSFGEILGERYKESTIQNLAKTIENCIRESIGIKQEADNNDISW